LISNSSTVAGNLIVGNDYSGLWVGWGALETTYMQNTIERNLVAYNFYGIKLSYGASLNNLTNNLVMHNMHEGIGINDEENGNVLRQNTMVNNTYNINVYGGKHDIDTSNTVNGRPVYYLVGKQGFHVPQDAGYIGAVDCTNITVSGVLIRNVGKVLLVNVTGSIFENMDVSQTYAWGMYMLNSHNNTVRNVTLHHPSSHNLGLRDSCGNKIADSILANSNTGIDLYNSSRNIIVRNSIEGNYHGIFTTYSSNNRICHNNFLNNTHQIFIGLDSANNTWDNGCEGNYWSNYNGTDLGNDGVGDTYFPWEGVDNYPLMNPYWNAGDIDHDLDVDIFDVVRTAGAYDSIPSSPHWNPHCDIAEPYGIVNIFDIVLIASSYGEEYTP
jgi:parallel beta-helix repeat protein